MWPPPPPMRHPSQFINGPGRPPPPVFPSRELAPMDYPPGPSAALPPHFHPPPLAAVGTSFGPDERSMPPWHRRMGGEQPLLNDSWKTAADSSWRQPPRHFGPYSNHEFYRQQYAQLPLSRPHPNFHPAAPPPPQHFNNFGPPHHFGAGELMPMHSFENSSGARVAVPPEYATARADYERRLEQTRTVDNNNTTAVKFCDFSRVPNEGNGANAAGLMPGEGAIELLTQPSAKRIRVKWSFRMPETNDKLKLHLTVRLEKLEAGLARVARGSDFGMVMDKVMPIHITHSEFNAFPGSSYRIDLRIIDSKDNQLASGTVYERAIFSLEEMKVLMQKAIDFTGTEMQPFTYLYRCKPKIYWDYVINETRAEMNPYEKDSNGQAASPINTAISGLFFSARLDPKGLVPTQSPFGDVRFMLPASMLLQPQLNLYFADFYCNTKPHYVTVVVCREFSDVDRFCRRTCIPLAPFDNPFLLFQPNNSPTVPLTFSAKRNVWVEIYYTDNVPLAWGQLHHISTFGVGTSKIGGLPHNKSCRVCNLHPQGPSGGETAQPLPENVEPIPAEKAEQMVREAAAAELVDERDEEEEDRERREQGKDGAGREGEESHQRRDTTTENGQRQVPFDELQNRLQQIERVVAKDAAALVGAASVAAQCAKGNGGDGSTGPANFVEFVQQIGGFLSEMHQDFKDLNSKIDAMESIIWLQRNDEEEALGEPIGGLELIDEAYDDADFDALLRDDNDEEVAQKEAENDVDKNRTEQRKANNKNDVSISVHETVDELLGRVKKLEEDKTKGTEEDKQNKRTDKQEKQTLRRTRRRTSTTNATAATEDDGRKKRCRRESR